MNPLLLTAALLSSFAVNAAPAFPTEILVDGSDIYEHHFSILRSSIVTIRNWSPVVVGSNQWGEMNEEARFSAGLTRYDGDQVDQDAACQVACRFKINGRSYENNEKQGSNRQRNLVKEQGNGNFVTIPTLYNGAEQTYGNPNLGFYDVRFKDRTGAWNLGCKPAPVPLPSTFWFFVTAIAGVLLASQKAVAQRISAQFQLRLVD